MYPSSRLAMLGAMLALSVALLSGSVGFAQEPPPDPNAISDSLTISANGVPLFSASITEAQEAAGVAVSTVIPGTAFDFLEPPGGTANLLSDRLIINPFQIVLRSDTELPMPARANAIKVPVEIFTPLVLRASSDGENPTVVFSDAIDILPFGLDPRHIEFSEGNEVPISFEIPALSYDIYEDGGVSDYLDITSISGIFASDLETAANIPPIPDGFVSGPPVVESLDGGFLTIQMDFRSDVVPEPSTVTLLGFGAIALVIGWRRRRLHA